MWTVFSPTKELIAIIGLFFITVDCAVAQSTTNSNTRSFGFNLPSPQVQNGFDEVRASDGTTCRSSISTGGAFLDVGGIGAPEGGGGGSEGSVYARLVIPLGKRRPRLNCQSLYQLEIDRLKHELELIRSTVAGAQSGASDDLLQGEEWNN